MTFLASPRTVTELLERQLSYLDQAIEQTKDDLSRCLTRASEMKLDIDTFTTSRKSIEDALNRLSQNCQMCG